MDKINDGGLAFPASRYEDVYGGPQIGTTNVLVTYPGMSLRDWFAGQALAGQTAFEGMEGCDPELMAGCAYEVADAMLEKRSKP